MIKYIKKIIIISFILLIGFAIKNSIVIASGLMGTVTDFKDFDVSKDNVGKEFKIGYQDLINYNDGNKILHCVAKGLHLYYTKDTYVVDDYFEINASDVGFCRYMWGAYGYRIS